MKSFIFYTSIAAALIFTSCAQKQTLAPVSIDETREFPTIVIEVERSETEEPQEQPTTFVETEINAFPYGSFIIEEIYVYRDQEQVARSLVISGERDLWIQTDKNAWTPNIEYAEAKLADVHPDRFAEHGEYDKRVIRVRDYNGELEGGNEPDRLVSTGTPHMMETHSSTRSRSTANEF